MDTQVTRNDEAGRYELFVDGHRVAIADFQVEGDVVVMPHTVVDPAQRGRGLGEVLVAAALDDVRSAGRTVVPACWFVAEFIDSHPDYRDLRAG
jgi:predicted GNAT family acetyltransferase